MRVTYKKISILLIVIFLVPLLTENVSSMEYVSSYDLIKPVNQRINNDFSVFEHSGYIDWQVDRFMLRSSIKGVSIAVIDNEKLVFSRSYGYADEEKGIKTTPEHLFRIASVSKLITAIAVMKLVDEGSMHLNDYVFGPNGYFNDEKYLDVRDKRLNEITVLNLLNHTSGWTQRYGDPAFNPLIIANRVGDTPPATIDTYLKFVVSSRLYSTPGTTYSYSNIAYMFLGAIIEKVTGMRYEDFVRYQILYPNGIYDMHIAQNTYEERFPNEVKYYEQDGSPQILSYKGDSTYVSKTYGGNDVCLLGAAGGWIASAPELAKLLTIVDGFENVPDFLSTESIENMTGKLENPLGWKAVEGGFWYRTGSFAGTAAMLHRRPDGKQWVFLCNTSNWQGPEFSKDIDRLMRRILKRVDKWPDQDLFNYFNSESLSYYPSLINDSNLN